MTSPAPLLQLTRYKEKFGEGPIAGMLEYMKGVGAKEGIAFSYGGKIADTTDAHRVMELA